MNENVLNVIPIQARDIEANWLKNDFVPKSGMFVVYEREDLDEYVIEGGGEGDIGNGSYEVISITTRTNINDTNLSSDELVYFDVEFNGIYLSGEAKLYQIKQMLEKENGSFVEISSDNGDYEYRCLNGVIANVTSYEIGMGNWVYDVTIYSSLSGTGRTTPYTKVRFKLGDGISTLSSLPFIDDPYNFIGKKTSQGGEIFNDYESNIAVGEYSNVQGLNNKVVLYGYSITELVHDYRDGDDPSQPSEDGYYHYTLSFDDKVEYKSGDVLSCNLSPKSISDAIVKGVMVWDDGGGSVNHIPSYHSRVGIKTKTGGLTLTSDDVATELDNLTWCVTKPQIGGKIVNICMAAHAEGQDTLAANKCAHAEGRGTVAAGNSSHAEGHFTKSFGHYAHTEGKNTIASGQESHAEGYGTTASGLDAHSEGLNTVASNYQSHAEGSGTTASGEHSHSEGITTVAQGNNSHAEGEKTKAVGIDSHSEGKETLAEGNYSHAEGDKTKALGESSHTEGRNTKATNVGSHAEGVNTKSTHWATHAEGEGTEASGQYAHAEGKNAKATHSGSHAEGYDTVAGGVGSHAEGRYSQATKEFSHAGGLDTITSKDAQTVIGIGNNSGLKSSSVELLSQDSLFVVGNGKYKATTDTSPKEKVVYYFKNQSGFYEKFTGTEFESGKTYYILDRSNAFTVQENGTAMLQEQGNYDNSVVIKKTLNDYLMKIYNISLQSVEAENLTLPTKGETSTLVYYRDSPLVDFSQVYWNEPGQLCAVSDSDTRLELGEMLNNPIYKVLSIISREEFPDDPNGWMVEEVTITNLGTLSDIICSELSNKVQELENRLAVIEAKLAE